MQVGVIHTPVFSLPSLIKEGLGVVIQTPSQIYPLAGGEVLSPPRPDRSRGTPPPQGGEGKKC